ncbi:type II toxin-antitoxin system Phd/YefM family antitoxin [Desulfobacter curvatus]|uniref:type II toxin-antitoxin system Phd/YefM family antitoxin n=1 Tax=Desulfobacter curvatus TaxID=2290 RepID=UPI00036BD43F|nr:type II toxin-antitoxin system Phd/YefM family antitoxin [Desulfobacter curvatus]
MGKLSNIIPISDLRQDAAKLLKRLQKSKDPLIITQRGRASAVIIGVDAYEEGRIPIFTVMQLTMKYVNWPFVSDSSIVPIYSMSAA